VLGQRDAWNVKFVIESAHAASPAEREEDLDPKRVERAVMLSVDKYCSVRASLAGSVKVTHSHEIVGAEEKYQELPAGETSQ